MTDRMMTARMAVLAACMAASAPAATYVIDTLHPQAGDANPGTREAPLRTISAGAARAVAGDEVVVRPGVYRECVVLTNSGAWGRPIVLRSEEPHAAVICGSDVVTNWQAAGPGIWVTDVPNLQSNQYAFPHAERGGPWVYIHGAPLQYADTPGALAPGLFHLDFVGKRLFVAPEEGLTIADVRVEYAHRAGLIRPERALDDIHVIGFTLLHNAEAFRHRPALQLRGRRWRAENNRILWAGYAGLLMDYTSEAVVRGNVIEWAGCQGIGGSWNRRLLVESNVVRFCNWRRINPSFEGGGLKWAMSHDGMVRGNRFSYNHGGSIWFDWANCNNVFERNLCHDNSWGMFAECNWDEIFRENIVFNSSAGLIFGESVGCLAQRNILFNNDLGIQIRGDYSRAHGAGLTPEGVTNWVGKAQAIPDVEPSEVDRVAAGFVKYHGATPSFMSDNNTLWENLIFDSESAYWEARDYGTPHPKDPYINNFSDYNLLHVPTNRVSFWPAPVLMQHRSGGYATLADWQRVSGRDLRSVSLDPRTATNLPAWAEARRNEWDIPLRRRAEIRMLGLIHSPSACMGWGRWLRSPTIEPLPLKDPQVKAYFLDVEGERTLMLWTCHEMARRYVRLALEQDEVTVENGYLQRETRRLPVRSLDLVVSWLPVYLRGLKGPVHEVAAAALAVAPFNPPDRAVTATATFPNASSAPLELDATVSVSRGFAARPDRIRQTVAPGESARIELALVPDGSVRRGPAALRLDAAWGAERLCRIARFSIGEAGGTIPRLAGAIRVDGRLDDWPAVTNGAAPLGLVAEASQFASGKPGAWQGEGDLSGKIYAQWSTQALYVAVTVTDDRVVGLPAPAFPWDGDCVEVFFDGRSGDMQWQPPPTEGCFQIGIAPAIGTNAPNVATWSQSAPRPLPGLQAATATRADGYAVELMIPLTLRNFPAGEWAAGRPVKLSVLFYDRDDPRTTYTDCTFGWSFSEGGANFRDTSGWRTLVLEH